MRVETKPAGQLYHLYKHSRVFQELHDSADFLPEAEKELPSALVLDHLDELGEGYIITPVERVFRHYIQRVGLPFQGSRFELDRTGSTILVDFNKPTSFRFEAYKSEREPFPKIEYERMVFPRKVMFDDLESEGTTIEEVILDIEKCMKTPSGEILKFLFENTTFTFHEGYDHIKWFSECLRTHSNLGWNAGNVRKLKVEQYSEGVGETSKETNFLDFNLEESLDLFRKRIDLYLEANSYL